MKLTFKTDIPKNLKKIANLPYEKALEAGGIELKGIISDEADKGKGYKGGFVGYSSAYKKIRAEKKRKTSPANLQISGEMLRSIFSKKTKAKKVRGGYVIELQPPNRKHSKSKSNIKDIIAGNDKRRPFFGLNRIYEQRVRKVVVKYIEREYAKLQLS